jgi:uncharacterized membrane protein YkoI
MEGQAIHHRAVEEVREMNAKKVLIAVAAAMMLLVCAGVAYAQSSAGDDGDDSYKGGVSAPDQSGASLQESVKIDQATAEEAALEAVPGTVYEIELETIDNGFVVYDVEVAGEDGKNHEVKVDAGTGEILNQGPEGQADEADGPGDAEDADESVDTEDSDAEPGDSDGPNDIEDVD